jgi:hypothetical protein
MRNEWNPWTWRMANPNRTELCTYQVFGYSFHPRSILWSWGPFLLEYLSTNIDPIYPTEWPFSKTTGWSINDTCARDQDTTGCMLDADPDRDAIVCLGFNLSYVIYHHHLNDSMLVIRIFPWFFMHKKWLEHNIYLRVLELTSCLLRAGSEDGQPVSETQGLNTAAAQSATSAKMKTLPALQANQDPFGESVALSLEWMGSTWNCVLWCSLLGSHI